MGQGRDYYLWGGLNLVTKYYEYIFRELGVFGIYYHRAHSNFFSLVKYTEYIALIT